MKYHQLLKENHSACSSKNLCTRFFRSISNSNADKDTDKNILPFPYFSQSKVGKENKKEEKQLFKCLITSESPKPSLRVSNITFQNYSENSCIKSCDTILMFLSLWSLSFCNHAQGSLKSRGESLNF